MRALLDESLPRGLTRHLADFEVETVYERGWSGLANGELLKAASADFDVFFTADQNLQYQQNLRGFGVGVVVLAAVSNRIEDLLPLIPAAISAAREVIAGEVLVVGQEPS